MRNSLLFIFVVFTLVACGEKTKSKPTELVAQDNLSINSIKKIDIHSHFKYTRDSIQTFFEKWNMQGLLVDVAHENTRSWDSYVQITKQHPETFYLCSSLVGTGIDSPDFANENIKRLDKEIALGAKMVKVWKNFGMVTKDDSGSFIQIDDDRLQPIWDYLAKKGIPVIAHIAEPVQAWRPLDDPKNPHYGYYNDNPQYHAYKIPEIPAYETIIKARDKWIENNPNLTILCAHMGSMSHDVEMIAERLNKFPNMSVEPAARFGDLAGQDSEKVKDFFITFQDRILFGTDYGNSLPKDSLSNIEQKDEFEGLHANYSLLWNYLSGTDSLIIRNQKTKGLGLSTNVLNKVYHQNARILLKLAE
ncbi:amidohydrolase family protein [Maribacter sp. HTCC2170]|uniref:amidohydrolase family protein n=1 Tax=Maribacter sp. (strain HTCC2170 / KCCM 42371) TaxID=313603 RepID=UPI00006B49C7|nr:amidohydrolase family protein [Maribacter sp. HTCC2170]EAR00958.1 hypothetical protein FB2170_09311 [Maribacter sp. HTCC2170]